MNIVTKELARLHRDILMAHEADAYLELPPGDPASRTQALLDDRVALFDYALKSQAHAARRIAAAWSGGLKQE